jgi:hypothetical protein
MRMSRRTFTIPSAFKSSATDVRYWRRRTAAPPAEPVRARSGSEPLSAAMSAGHKVQRYGLLPLRWTPGYDELL